MHKFLKYSEILKGFCDRFTLPQTEYDRNIWEYSTSIFRLLCDSNFIDIFLSFFNDRMNENIIYNMNDLWYTAILSDDLYSG